MSLVGEYGLQGEVQVRGSFCLEHCSEGVSVKVGDKVMDCVREGEVREKLLPEILTQAHRN
jgi:NADH:ubiquinone oxidoreductase subunit E